MKNPMLKRIWREIKGEAGKYFVIFLFMTVIGGILGIIGIFGAVESCKFGADFNYFENASILVDSFFN